MFTWQEINEDWLLGGKLALPAQDVVRAFNIVVARFGREWVEVTRISGGTVVRGMSTTLHVITLGQMLESLGQAPNSEHLLEKVRAGLSDAWAELMAIHLVCSGVPGSDLEIEPSVVVGTRNRKPDFRLRKLGEDWTYVEVTQAVTSKAGANVRRGLDRLTRLVDTSEGSFALEVFLKREPSRDEVEAVAAEIISRHRNAGLEHVELDDGLGTLYWNTDAPGIVTLDNHGQAYRPALGAMRTVVQNGEQRHISVRWPFTDERAQAFLDSETKQLPKDAPGLIMIQTSGAVGAMKAWRALIERRFQPSIYTRVSAVCLFSSGLHDTPAGEEWRPEAKLISNPYARLPLPAWIPRQLERFPSDRVDLPNR